MSAFASLAVVAALSATEPALATHGADPAVTAVAISSTSGTPLAECEPSDESTPIAWPGSEVEPTLAVNPTNPANVVVAWQQDRTTAGGARGIVVASSFDGGTTWETTTSTKSSICTGRDSAVGGLPRVTDPWLSFAADGSLYLMSLGLREPSGQWDLWGPSAMSVARSFDGGRTWTEPIDLIRDEGPNVFNDKNSLTADPADPRRAYAVWSRMVAAHDEAHALGGGSSFVFGGVSHVSLMFSRTTDGGTSWESPRAVLAEGVRTIAFAPQLFVLPAGESHSKRLAVLFGYEHDRKNKQGGRGVRLAVITSDDFGSTWSEPVPIADELALPARDPLTGETIRGGRWIPDFALDPVTGALFAVWHDGRFSNGSHNDVAMSMSIDGGTTWTAPVRANMTPPAAAARGQALTPSVVAAPGGGVHVGYYDLRNNADDDDAGDPLETDRFAVTCESPSAQAADLCSGDWTERQLTESSFDLRRAPRTRGLFLGDYVGRAHNGSSALWAFAVASSDPRTSTVYFVREAAAR